MAGLLLPHYSDDDLQNNAYLLYPPDWENAKIKFSRRHIGNVLGSIKGDEQRSVYSSIVRHSLSYRITTLSPYKAQKLERMLRKFSHQVIGVPVWIYEMTLTADCNIGDTVIYVDSAAYREINRFEAILIGSIEDYMVRNVETYDTTSITFQAGGPSAVRYYAAGTKVYPVMRCTIENTFDMPMVAPYIIQTTVDLQESFNWSDSDEYSYYPPLITPSDPSLSMFETYNGYYVFNWFPTWTTNPKQKMNIQVYRTGSDFGFTYQNTYQEIPCWGMEAFHSVVGVDRIGELTNFFDYMGGRRGKFWLPSFQPAFKLTSGIGVGDTWLSVENHDIVDQDELNTFHRYIYIYRKGHGNSFCRKLTGVQTNKIQIDQALGVSLEVSDVEMICFLYMVRFDIDELELSYPAGLTVAESTLYFNELIKGYPT